jgi:hypothetical protein
VLQTCLELSDPDVSEIDLTELQLDEDDDEVELPDTEPETELAADTELLAAAKQLLEQPE